jgi:uncharacterized SAM-binding protein YcdF (DUF218 family)
MELQAIAKIFINPLLYIYAAFAIILFKSSIKLKLKLSITLIIYLISIEVTPNILLNLWSVKDNKNQIKYDYAVILAGGVDFKWYLKKQVKNDLNLNFEQYFKFIGVEERIFTGIEIVRNGGAEKILYSNWVPSMQIKNKKFMYNASQKSKDFSIKMGLPKSNFIIYGNKINRTIDEVNELKLFLRNKKSQNILLITSQSHMRRSLGLFKNKSISVDHYSVSKVDNILEVISSPKSYIPNINGLSNTQNFLYEFIGYIGYLIIGEI